MTQEQQELYEKLLKKVNEYCLGYAAEDVIAAIDALVENYETALKEYEMEHTLRIRLENANYELVREKQENDKKLKALEIIKKKRLDVSFFMSRIEKNPEFYSTAESMNKSILKITTEPLTQEEFKLLKEILL